jgi:actin-like ATPase involved in cell morphogenesis
VGYYIGVDLGTTYTAAAVARGDRVEVAALGNHSTAVASVLWVGEHGDVLVGEAAQRRALTDPARVAREFKRRLGDTTPLLLGGTPYSVESLSSKLLSWVVAEVARTEGEAPDGVAVTHPANWGAYKKDLLAQAVRLADLPTATMLTEPQAAAIFYASQQRVDAGGVVAVFDLGGGTFDAAVIRKVDDGRFDILGEPEGIERLGGIDFDDAVFAHVVSMVQAGFDDLDPEDSTAVTAVARLREECIEAKEVLSSDTDVSIAVLLPGLSTEVRLTRAEFEGMIRPRIEDAIGAMRRSLATAQVDAKDVGAILLVGGSSRIPLVAQMVSAAFGRPVAVDAHPKNAIAMGAAIAARTAAGEDTPVAAAVATSELPVQPGREDLLAATGVAGGDAAATAALPVADATATMPLRTPPPPPPPPMRKGGKSLVATVIPALLGLVLLGGGSYFMFFHHHHAKKASTAQTTAPPHGTTGGGGGTVQHQPTAPATHRVTNTDPILVAPPAGDGPFDTSGSTDCNTVAAIANNVTTTTPDSGFSAQCNTVPWHDNGTTEQVVAFSSKSSDNSAIVPTVEVLTQDSTGTWTVDLLSTATAAGWESATIKAVDLTGDGDDEFVVVFHYSDGGAQIDVVQNSNGAPAVEAQTNKAFSASVVQPGTEILLFGRKTVDSPLRLDTIKWDPSQGFYIGAFTPVTSEPTSEL